MSLFITQQNKIYQRLLAIGDLHGCRDKLQQLFKAVQPTSGDRLVFLGDYIDRGDDSPGVVDDLISLQKEQDCIFLLGNHEQMLLDYVDGQNERFLLNRGQETLRQYRKSKWGEIPAVHLDFFRDLKLCHRQDGFIFVHAGMEFVEVLGGSFDMGDTFGDGDENEKPVHRVNLDGFRMGKYPVTQAQWQKVMVNNPSEFKGENRPVECVSWDDAQRFIHKLNQQSESQYRLPTEAEWEYAARSGGKHQKWSGTSDENKLEHYA